MFTRDAYSQLLDWKSQGGKTAILIEGARRVGKTTLAETFARTEYATHLVIDFSRVSPDIVALFTSMRHDIDRFLSQLQVLTGTRLIERDAIIVFDEVQRLPIAREFIKHLVADGRYDYLETGSLISIRKNVQDIVIPSEEEKLVLHPLSFSEWLSAMNQEALADEIAQSRYSLTPLLPSIHTYALRLMREYLLVGGMPQAVLAYRERMDFHDADTAKRNILNLYRDDIKKFGSREGAKTAAIYKEIPAQLSKPKKRFYLASVDDNARYRDYAGALYWLEDSKIANLCKNSTDPNVGLRLHENSDQFKCYMADTGLLVTHTFADRASTSNSLYRSILLDKLEVNEGMIVENYVAQQLRASGHELFYYSRTDRNNSANTMEIDFLVVGKDELKSGNITKAKISPIEVKSKKRYSTRSLDKFKTKFGKRVGTQYVLHPRSLTTEGDRIYLPLYMAHLL